MSRFYTTSEAARLAGVTASTVRNYTRSPRLAPFFGDTATATGGKARQLAATDVKVLHFIAEATRTGETIESIAARLQAGEISVYEWEPPAQEARFDAQEGPGEPQGPQQATTGGNTQQTALATLQTFAIAMQSEFIATRQREQELTAALIDAERRAAAAEAELTALRAQRRGLFARIFGR